jgi:hypothetical protein
MLVFGNAWALEFSDNPPLWHALPSSGTPEQATQHIAALDERRQRVLTFGGWVTFLRTEPGVLQFDLGTGAWSVLATDGPESPGRYEPIGAFDPALDRWLIASSYYYDYSPLNSVAWSDNQVYALWSDSSTPTRIAFADARFENGAVFVRWSGDPDGSELAVWRRRKGDVASNIGFARQVSPGLFEFEDRTATPGEHYAYQLQTSDRDFSEEAWIDVPAAAFTFAPVRPNPSIAPWTLEWALPLAGDVSLSVRNVVGRTVLRKAWTSLPAGRHVETLPESAGLAPGIYFVAIEFGGTRQVRRGVRIAASASAQSQR